MSTISAELIKNISQWAYKYGLTQLPLSTTQMMQTASRYNVAQMFTQFATRIQKKSITHNAACDISKYSDYATFTSEMKTTITQVCDLGLMGLKANSTSLIAKFDATGTITADQLSTIINRYMPGIIAAGTTVGNHNLDVLYWLLQIAAKK